MTRKGQIWLACCLLILGLFAQQAAAEDSLHFLLETDAAYELKFTYPNRMDTVPPILSIYTYDEQGPILNLSRLYQGLVYDDLTEMNLIFEAPKGYLRAEVKISADEVLGPTALDIERVDRFDPEQESMLAHLIVNEMVYTGLVVDARGLGLERGMSPRIWSESGELIYGGVAADYEFVLHEGVISYGQELSDDLMDRVSIPGKLIYSAPLVVQALGVKGEPQTGVVISQEAADRILAAIKNYDFFAHYAVVFLID